MAYYNTFIKKIKELRLINIISKIEKTLNIRILTDKLFLSIKYKSIFGKPLDLVEPKTFSEKLQWLKLFHRNPKYITLVDKYAVREYVTQIIGKKYLIPLIGVWKSPDEIDFEKLPNQFVLKCNHDSGGICICQNKSTFDTKSAIKKLSKSLNTDFYIRFREWPYKNVSRKIIAEKYMEDTETKELRDYKYFCFNGVVKAMFVATDRQDDTTDTKFDFFDADYNHLDFTHGHPNATQMPKKPKNFELMKLLAQKLSTNIPHVRVDFYEIDGKVYFGEMTLFHHSGLVPFKPGFWDKEFGSWLDLPSTNY